MSEDIKRFIQSLGKGHPKTPDFVTLEESAFQLLFVCDDLMVPHQNYKLLEQYSRRVGRAFTRGPFDYRIENSTGRGLPFVARRTNAFMPLKIKGELHQVRSHVIKSLDEYYDNGVVFHRVRGDFLVTSRTHELIVNISEDGRDLPPALQGPKHVLGPEMVYVLEAHMYVASSKYWSDKLDGGYDFPRAEVQYPREDRQWLRHGYYKYPITRNRCLK